MWKQIKIGSEIYFLATKFVGHEVRCALYDFKECWGCAISVEELPQQAKIFNKRIQYDDNKVREVLEQSEPEQATLVRSGSGGESRLKLKYRIGGCPFNFEWSLAQQASQAIQQNLLLPLFNTVKDLSQQVDELRNAVYKKDYEIQQYRAEFQILRRTTVKTNPFDFTKFDDKFARTNLSLLYLLKMGEYLRLQLPPEQSDEPKPEAAERLRTGDAGRRLSPRDRKRRAVEERKRQLEQNLNSRKKKLKYEDSSQSHSEDLLDAPIRAGRLNVKVQRGATSAKAVPVASVPMDTSEPQADVRAAAPAAKTTNEGRLQRHNCEIIVPKAEREQRAEPVKAENNPSTCSVDNAAGELPSVDIELSQQLNEMAEVFNSLKKYRTTRNSQKLACQ